MAALISLQLSEIIYFYFEQSKACKEMKKWYGNFQYNIILILAAQFEK